MTALRHALDELIRRHTAIDAEIETLKTEQRRILIARSAIEGLHDDAPPAPVVAPDLPAPPPVAEQVLRRKDLPDAVGFNAMCKVCGNGYRRTGNRQIACGDCRAMKPGARIPVLERLYAKRNVAPTIDEQIAKRVRKAPEPEAEPEYNVIWNGGEGLSGHRGGSSLKGLR